MENYKYIGYKPERDVVFVLGAGASNPDGVPLQKEIIPFLLSGQNEEITNSNIGKQVIKFIRDNFAYEPDFNEYPRLEAVFGFLDYFIQHQESLSAEYTYEKIIAIKENLIKAIHYIVNLETHKQSKYYHRLWHNIVAHNKNVSFITLNYDTLLEQSFDHFFKSVGYLDYCIHLMNFEKDEKLTGYNFWVNPREPLPVKDDTEPVPFKIIKLHGSLNWKYCNCCNQTLLTPWDRKIDLQHGRFLGYTYPGNEEYEYVCPLDNTDFQTLIMPPSYVKVLRHPVISQLMNEASREIRSTKKIVFVGYSLSDADIHIKALFKKQINDDTKIAVINIKKKEELQTHYYALSEQTEFYNSSFQEMVFDDEMMARLLNPNS